MLTIENTNAQHAPLIESQDHTSDVVPLSERRGPVTLGLLWLTMVTGFPTVLIGFDWCKAGLTLSQVIQSVFLSCLVLLVYSVPAVYLGAKSGQTYALLSRKVFGRWGSALVSLNLVWIVLGWYGITADFLADGLLGLYHWPVSTMWLAAILALAMAFNNFFGFTGIANFARYLAAPVLIVWVAYTFVKAVFACPASVLTEVPHTPFVQSLTLVSSFVIGYGVWGNEADYWRYSKPKMVALVVPIVVTLVVGQIIFPITGWMMAKMTGIIDYAGATALMNQYAFGGITIIAAVVLAVTYFAVNDSGLYGAINALENIREIPRKKVVAVLAFGGAAAAAIFSFHHRVLEWVAILNSIILPVPTVIMITEWFILSPILRLSVDLSRVVRYEDLPTIRYAATIALITGIVVGVLTSGLIPGTQNMHFVLCSVAAWLTSLIVYLPLRLTEHWLSLGQQCVVLEQVSDDIA